MTVSLDPCGCGSNAALHKTECDSIFVKCDNPNCDNRTGNYRSISAAILVWNKKARRAARRKPKATKEGE